MDYIVFGEGVKKGVSGGTRLVFPGTFLVAFGTEKEPSQGTSFKAHTHTAQHTHTKKKRLFF